MLSHLAAAAAASSWHSAKAGGQVQLGPLARGLPDWLAALSNCALHIKRAVKIREMSLEIEIGIGPRLQGLRG